MATDTDRHADTTCEQRRTRRACYVEHSHMEIEHGDRAYLDVELSCGHAFTWDDGTPPDYCPYCGAKVVVGWNVMEVPVIGGDGDAD